MTYFVSYSCPRCKAELEVQHEDWQGWRRCPACGLPSLPPELLFGHPTTRRRVQGGDDEPEISDEMTMGEDSIPWGRSKMVEPQPSSAFGPARVILVILFVVSLFLLLLFYLDQNQQLTGIFGGVSFVLFLLLLRSPRRRSRDEE
ncbi:MAG: hypothetical protein ACLQGP_05450 [Isosphaeraceae bacterium]